MTTKVLRTKSGVVIKQVKTPEDRKLEKLFDNVLKATKALNDYLGRKHQE